MPSFGEKLRHERESRNTPLADVAKRTRIAIRYLEALERNEFEALPGTRGFGKLYIRAYAEMFGFDPDPLIAQYDAELQRRERASAAAAAAAASDDRGAPQRPRRIRFTPRRRESDVAEAAGPAPVAVEQASEPELPQGALPVRAEPETPLPETMELQTAAASAPKRRQGAGPGAAAAESGPGVVGPRIPAGPAVPSTVPWWRRHRLVAAVCAVVALVLLGVVLRPRATTEADAPPPSPTIERTAVAPDEPAVVPEETAPVVEEPAAPETQAVALKPADTPEPERRPVIPPVEVSPPVAPRPLTVTDHAVGRRVVNRRLVGAGSEFREGSRVSFLTRVRGAAPGQTIRHAWLREGRLIQSIELSLGGSQWRTYSNKTLWGTGEWAVEARDADGAVLARAEFRCVPSGS